MEKTLLEGSSYQVAFTKTAVVDHEKWNLIHHSQSTKYFSEKAFEGDVSRGAENSDTFERRFTGCQGKFMAAAVSLRVSGRMFVK